jgi:hypothetical protein
MTRKVKMKPCAPETETLPAIEIRHRDREQPARTEQAPDGRQVSADIIGVLE